LLFLLAAGCLDSEPAPGPVAGSEEAVAELPILDERESWPRVEAPRDLAQLEDLKNSWIEAFESGDAEALDFVFSRDAVMTDLADLVGEEDAHPDRFFEMYDAEFALTNDLPIEYGNWGSYYADYALKLTPKDGGPVVEDGGGFMVRLWRVNNGTFEVVLGPQVGDLGPEFALNRMDGSGEVQLATLRDKPTVLVFGSFT
jgi:hypothetical protein